LRDAWLAFLPAATRLPRPLANSVEYPAGYPAIAPLLGKRVRTERVPLSYWLSCLLQCRALEDITGMPTIPDSRHPTPRATSWTTGGVSRRSAC